MVFLFVNNNKIEINISDLSAGYYQIRATSATGEIISKSFTKINY